MRENSFISNFKLLLKGSLFLGIVFGILFFAGQRYMEAASKNAINAFTKERYDGFYAQERNMLDLVFVGSSHSYCTFDPSFIDERLGTNSWQMGTPAQHPDTTYYCLKEVLKYQNPKTVVMEIYWDMLDDEFEPKQADSLFEVLKDDEIKNEFVHKGFPWGEKVKYHIPAIKYQQDYFIFKGAEAEVRLEKKYNVTKSSPEAANGVEYYLAKGYVYCDIVIPQSEFDKTNQFKRLDGRKWEFNDNQKKYVERIITLCKENDIELIFVTAPIANVSMEFIKAYDKIHDKVATFAAESNISYLDYNMVNQEESLLENENFRDDAHLNDSGVKIVDKHFVDWLKNNPDIKSFQ